MLGEALGLRACVEAAPKASVISIPEGRMRWGVEGGGRAALQTAMDSWHVTKQTDLRGSEPLNSPRPKFSHPFPITFRVTMSFLDCFLVQPTGLYTPTCPGLGSPLSLTYREKPADPGGLGSISWSESSERHFQAPFLCVLPHGQPGLHSLCLSFGPHRPIRFPPLN